MYVFAGVMQLLFLLLPIIGRKSTRRGQIAPARDLGAAARVGLQGALVGAGTYVCMHTVMMLHITCYNIHIRMYVCTYYH